MKGNAKKGALFIGVVTIMMFIAAPMALAGQGGFHSFGINGVYAVTGFSSCDPASPGIMEAEYTFRIDGTGSISGVGRSIAASGGASNAFIADFTYTITKEGRIEFEYPFPPGGLKVDFNLDGVYDVTMDGGPSHGVISPDRKTITISCGPPVFLKIIDPDNGTTLFEPVLCVTSLAGMRIH